jgi:hypothetical protein
MNVVGLKARTIEIKLSFKFVRLTGRDNIAESFSLEILAILGTFGDMGFVQK